MPVGDTDNYGKQYGKPDIERLGIFNEMPYMNGKGYVPLFPVTYRIKGKNMISEGPKSKCGTQHGYFEDQFKRLFEGEVIVRPDKKKKKEKVKAIIPFMPVGSSKEHSTPGDYYGCFSGNITAFSNLKKPVPKYVRQPINFLTSPGKQGGPGYPDICLSKYPQHEADPYRPKIKLGKKEQKELAKSKGAPLISTHFPQPYFDKNPFMDPSGKIGPTYVRPKEQKTMGPTKGPFIPVGPAKWQGGSHAGCFEPFPEWKTNRTPPKKEKHKPIEKETFYPQSMALKTMQTVSILNQNVDFSVNCQNFNSYEPKYTQHLG